MIRTLAELASLEDELVTQRTIPLPEFLGAILQVLEECIDAIDDPVLLSKCGVLRYMLTHVQCLRKDER